MTVDPAQATTFFTRHNKATTPVPGGEGLTTPAYKLNPENKYAQTVIDYKDRFINSVEDLGKGIKDFLF